eukprot:1158414-Pelagomonas_calceolata.AAC.7
MPHLPTLPLQVSSFPAAPQVAGEDVEAADWQPGSSTLAYSSGNSLVFKDALQLGLELAKIDITHPDGACLCVCVGGWGVGGWDVDALSSPRF